jgi:arylsulfatase A-like enzyme
LSRELVRVPLIVKFPAAESSGRAAVVEQLVSHLDLWPTILDAFGLPAIEGRGTSLFARDVASDRVAVQTLGLAGDERHEFAVGDGRLRLVIDSEGVEHLFDTREDPGELRDLARERPQDVRTLRERGEAFVSGDPRPAVRGAPRKLDAESREALRKLGYTDGR